MRRAALAVLMALLPLRTGADEPPIAVSGAWVPPAQRGENVPLSMTIRNAGAPDALIRTRCAVANFIEPHAVDHGEGFPAMREIKFVPIEGGGTTVLTADGPHVMLLQIKSDLPPGAAFACTLTFKNAGRQEITVTTGGG